jgi:hypothetical protein
VHFQLRAKTFASRGRPPVHPADHVHIEIAKYEQACGGIFFAAHGGGILSLAWLEEPIGEISHRP